MKHSDDYLERRTNHHQVRESVVRVGSSLLLQLPALTTSAEQISKARRASGREANLFASDLHKDKLSEINKEDCCCPQTDFVPSPQLSPNSVKNPSAPILEEAATNFGNQFDYFAARRWKTIGLFAASRQRKECMITILVGEQHREGSGVGRFE